MIKVNIPCKRGNYRADEKRLFSAWVSLGRLPLRSVCECAVGPHALTAVFSKFCKCSIFIEPSPEMAAAARINYPFADVHEVAIGDAEGLANLRLMNGSSFVSGRYWAPAKSRMKSATAAPIVSVIQKRFDQIDDGQIDLLNLDCEGGEWFVLKFMVSRPRLIHLELYRRNPFYLEIIEWLRNNGYSRMPVSLRGVNQIYVKE